MELEKIINNLERCQPEIIMVLSANDWQHFRKYFLIRQKFISNDIENGFKRVFCNFYIMNGPMGLDKLQQKKFFEILLNKENNLENILRKLYKTGKRHRLFLSFGTKLLHTINTKLPIYDKNISFMLGLPAQKSLSSLEERIKNRIDIYGQLKISFSVLLKNARIISYLKNIRKILMIATSNNHLKWKNNLVSDVKLLDSLLWALYPIIKNNQ